MDYLVTRFSRKRLQLIFLQIHFPVNYLRNVAIKYCSTEYAIFADVDLVPNVGAYSYLKDFLAKHVQAKQEKVRQTYKEKNV